MPGSQRDMRVRDLAELDAIDKQIIAILSRDGRTTNADLAAAHRGTLPEHFGPLVGG